jgi:polysaccharide export outer membrane protein
MNLTWKNVLPKFALLMGCLCIGVGIASGQTSAQDKAARNPSTQSQPNPGPASQTMPTPPGNDYIIGPEDVISITVWKEPDVSRSVPVRPDGKISLPLIGEVEASGLTPPKLATVIAEKLKAYVSNPEVSVIVEQVKSQVVNIVGQVLRPSPMVLTRPTTILDAIALAGGPAQFAKLKSIYVLRPLPDGRQQKLYFNYKAVIKGQKLEQNIYLKSGDTLVVP